MVAEVVGRVAAAAVATSATKTRTSIYIIAIIIIIIITMIKNIMTIMIDVGGSTMILTTLVPAAVDAAVVACWCVCTAPTSTHDEF